MEGLYVSRACKVCRVQEFLGFGGVYGFGCRGLRFSVVSLRDIMIRHLQRAKNTDRIRSEAKPERSWRQRRLSKLDS